MSSAYMVPVVAVDIHISDWGESQWGYAQGVMAPKVRYVAPGMGAFAVLGEAPANSPLSDNQIQGLLNDAAEGFTQGEYIKVTPERQAEEPHLRRMAYAWAMTPNQLMFDPMSEGHIYGLNSESEIAMADAQTEIIGVFLVEIPDDAIPEGADQTAIAISPV